MDSINQLIHLIIYLYFGAFSYVLFNIIFFHQRKLLTIKVILLFSFIFYLLLKINYKYEIEFNFILLISFLIGFILAIKLLDKMLLNINNRMIYIIDLIKFLLNILFNPPIIKYLKCIIHTKHIYIKYPYLKPKGIEYLF